MNAAHEIEEQLALTLGAVRNHGPLTWQRVHDWMKAKMPRLVEPDDDEQEEARRNGKTDNQRDEAKEDAEAAAYHHELNTLTKRLDADLRRLRRIIEIANPAAPKPQPDAGCRSCFRDGGTYEPVWAGRYATSCRFCGEWRAEHGDWPPITVIRWRHRHPGKRVPLTIVEKARLGT